MNTGSDRDYSWYDQAYDKGYARGFADGAEKERSSGNWHLPEVRPKSGELIRAAVRPYSRKTERFFRRKEIRYIVIPGIYLSGKKLWEEEYGPNVSWDEEEMPDMILTGKKGAIAWNDAVLLWTSTELPEWFTDQFGDKGDET